MRNDSNKKIRVRRTAEDSREHILAAARQHVEAVGPLKFRLLDVAQAAGVTHGNVLAHFGSVEGLQRETALRFIDTIVAEVLIDLRGEVNGADAARRTIAALFRTLARPQHRRLLAWILMMQEDGPAPDVSRPFDAVEAVVVQMLVTKGSPAASDNAKVRRVIRLVASAALGSSVGHRYFAPLAEGADGDDQLAELMADLVIDGLT